MNRRDFARCLAWAPFLAWAQSSDRGPSATSRHVEVIVSSVDDARAAEAGGATRLEIAVQLDRGGLTPPLALVGEIVAAVSIPARVMLREQDALELAGRDERGLVLEKARQLAALRVEGLVTGYVREGRLDLDMLRAISRAAPSLHLTIHNAIERTADPPGAIEALASLSGVDRALVSGGSWRPLAERIAHLQAYRMRLRAGCELIAGSLTLDVVQAIRDATGIREFHFGSAVRTPEESFPHGTVDARKVARARELVFAGA